VADEPPFISDAVVEIIRNGTGCSERDAVLTARVLDQAKWLRKEAERG
jgi:predicted ATP-dependent protease